STQRWRQATKWVLATDMGMVTKKSGDDLWVWVNALADLTPVANASIQLISQNNQTLATARTDKDGIAVIQNYKRFTDEFVPYVITASAGDDFSFLELQRRRVPTSDFNVGGAAYLQHGYEAFLYNERGVYRPGETSHIAAIVRGENAMLPGRFPVHLRVTGPDNRVLTEKRATLTEAGAVEFDIPIPDYARTGRYRASLRIGEKKEIGFTTFNVEEFIPDRMKVKLKTDQDSYSTGESVRIDVEAVTLFGPPAAGRRVEAELEIERVLFSPPSWRSFTFTDAGKKFSKIKTDLGEQKLDNAGRFSYSYTIPSDLKPPSSLRGILSTTVLEPGGRGVSAYRVIEIHPYKSYVGLRKAQEGYAKPGAETKIEYVVVDPDGESLAQRTVEIGFYKITWHSILKRVDSQRGYRYISERVEELIRKFDVTSNAGVSSFVITPEDYGRYKIVARDKTSGASSSLAFYASGWGYAPWAMDNPDRIEIDLDKEIYSPGEKAKIQVRAPFSGKLLLTIERDRILDKKVITLTENTATIEMPVSDLYKPNVYVSAHLIRSTDGLERDQPVRAFGVVPLFVKTDDQKLTMEFKAPQEIRPNTELKIEVKVKGQKGHRPYLTIAVVDEGICQLTDFATPDPHGYFFGKKRLSVESYDIYGVVLPEISSSSLTATGGDLEAARKRQLTPVSVTRVKPVAFWSGLLKTDRKGRGKVTFKMPQFNGSVRIMAVALAGDKFGKAQQNVFVREPIVLTPTFPRFISATDKFRVPVSLYNGTGKDAAFEVALAVVGPAEVIGSKKQEIAIARNEEKQVYFDVQADEAIGEVKFKLTAKGGGESSSMSVDVPLRPPAPFVTLAGYGAVEQSAPQSFTFPAGWLEETVDFKLTLSSFPAVKFASSLQFLLRYPYGCIEQTTSKVFPLLAFDDLARLVEPELFKKNSADYFIEEGISRLENMQLVSGAFSYWPSSGYINNWSSVYAAHFLVEARKAGYVVSDRVYNKLMSALAATTRDYSIRDRYKNQTAVYACYVLALAGKPDKSTMLYLKNNVLDQLAQYSKSQLAGAFAFSGDLQTARSLLPNTVIALSQGKRRETGRNFNSSIRAQAIMLDILAQVDPKHAMVPVLVKNLSDAASKAGRWYNTQENAYAFLALGKILKQRTAENYTGTVSIPGKLNAKFNTDEQKFSGKDWAGKTTKIEVAGQGTCYYYWQAEGVPSTLTVDEFDRDLQVRRRYLDKNGNPIQYNQFKQGDMIIAEIAIKALSENLDNVAIVDMLPAGFEIENPRLQSRKGVDWIGDKAFRPAYMDIRDDRMIIFGNFRMGRIEKFYYGLRAVTAGEFILPPVRAEAMYAPQKTSVASSGKVVVSAL
ncbi:MAG: alpha-2-macroglobulin, partial [Calditrichaeota bacterium]|nr:alpha-2-macroglobulin [Calditrichota bacterium]